MRFKVLSLVAVMSALAACSHDNPPTAGAGGASSGINAGDTTTSSSAAEAELKNSVGDRVFFAFNSSAISGEARATLQRQAAFAAKYPQLTFTVEGHCDERGTREYNLALGERRATAAKDALVTLGVTEGRLQTISYGKERPAVLGSTESAYAQNRRAVTVVN